MNERISDVYAKNYYAEEPTLGAIQLGAPFSDHTILQRGMAVPVWGWSKPGTEVSVEFAGQKQTATAGQDGKWTVELNDLQASFEPAELVISPQSGDETGTLASVIYHEDEIAVNAALERGDVEAAKKRIMTLAPPYDPEAVDYPVDTGKIQFLRSNPFP